MIACWARWRLVRIYRVVHAARTMAALEQQKVLDRPRSDESWP